MITTPLKIGIAAACLVVVAVLIAVDQSRLRKDDSTTPIPGVDIPQAVLPPPVLAAPAKAEEPVICPAPAAAAKAEAPAPKAEAAAAPAAPPAPPAPPKKILIETIGGQRYYTVVQGDTLYGISVKVYNTPRHYERIYEANHDRIADPNTLQIGMKLLVPDFAARTATATN
jgi:nucleoid-associated protein YgaU